MSIEKQMERLADQLERLNDNIESGKLGAGVVQTQAIAAGGAAAPKADKKAKDKKPKKEAAPVDDSDDSDDSDDAVEATVDLDTVKKLAGAKINGGDISKADCQKLIKSTGADSLKGADDEQLQAIHDKLMAL